MPVHLQVSSLSVQDKMILWVLLVFQVQPYLAQDSVVIIFAQPGGNATFPRANFGAVDKLYVNWYYVANDKETALISRNPQLGTPKKDHPHSSLSQNFDLIIFPVQNSDFGLYRCEQIEYQSINEMYYRLYPVQMPTEKVIVAGNELNLDFELNYVGNQRLTVTCFMPDGNTYPITSYKRQFKLNIRNISVSHSGTWVFTVMYNQQKTILTTLVSVVDLVSSEETVYTSLSSSTFNLPCSLISSLPWSALNDSGFIESSWTFKPLNGASETTLLSMKASASPSWIQDSNSSFPVKHLNTPDFSVQSSGVSVNHRGKYTCKLRFNLRTLSKVVMVEVLQILSTANGTVLEGASVNLTCTVGYPLKPDQKVTWIPPQKSSLSPPPLPILSIPSVRVQDSGTWKCKLKSKSITGPTVNVKLEVVKAPVNTWLVVAVVSGVLIFILLIVIAIVIIRRYKQVIKYKRRKTRFCCCKNPQSKGFYRT